ncbi:hydantoinase/oxoprolinase family protein [Roseovarius arcticus]|uniref:hydantoinase/oxoprolinase family protein n=1 Tax=Roseovarius arcticus TaxID=2547404 RepID=UPI00111064AE|nr:hydantoinase/oxoprolinase family protein [Roseovarius arcticus]
MQSESYRIGVDIGGTFTDLVIVGNTGSVYAFKVPSNAANPTDGVIAAIELAARSQNCSVEKLLSETEHFVHGSTIATNTLLERKGSCVGLLTTKGFRDSLEIRRGLRENVWEHRTPAPEVLVPRYLRLPIDERVSADGQIIREVDATTVSEAAEVFRQEGVEAVAISLLHSYRNPNNEYAVCEMLKRHLPDVWITCSSDVAPVVGEYERTSTTVVNAYVAPKVIPYLRALNGRLNKLGLPKEVLIVQSNGGAISVKEIREKPVELILSGPAAGAGAIKYYSNSIGSDDILSIEVGGTSCDVMLTQNGVTGMTDRLEVDGNHLIVPAVDIETVGAGGGTIAYVDKGGLLRVGPEGAGAVPGPAAYGLGGVRPTVTDAQLVLGRLKPGPYAGGAISLDLSKATNAIKEHLADPLGLSICDAAAGVIQLAEQHMQHVVERVSVERGHDPRLFTLVAAGGAGPLHAPGVARALNCAGIFIPRFAGVFCAFGMCNTDIRHDYTSTWLRDLDDDDDHDCEKLRGEFTRLEENAQKILLREGFPSEKIVVKTGYDLRYYGQQWTVAVDVQTMDPDLIRDAFEVEYERRYGYAQPKGQIEIVNLRISATGILPKVLPETPSVTLETATPIAKRPVWINAQIGTVDVDIYDGRKLQLGHMVVGPAIIEEDTTTILLSQGDHMQITSADGYLIRPEYDSSLI